MGLASNVLAQPKRKEEKKKRRKKTKNKKQKYKQETKHNNKQQTTTNTNANKRMSFGRKSKLGDKRNGSSSPFSSQPPFFSHVGRKRRMMRPFCCPLISIFVPSFLFVMMFVFMFVVVCYFFIFFYFYFYFF